MKDQVKLAVANTKINFLIGAGLSVDVLDVLGNIEADIEKFAQTQNKLTDIISEDFLNANESLIDYWERLFDVISCSYQLQEDIEFKIQSLAEESDMKDWISKSKQLQINAKNYFDSHNEITKLLKSYFCKSILGNTELIKSDIKSGRVKEVLDQYISFFRLMNQIINRRESSLLSKQINIFTTNIDIFSEIALEESNIEFNDGFSGKIRPTFDVGNFNKSYFKTSMHYEKRSEIPVFNLVKLHGSVSWRSKGEGSAQKIEYDRELAGINAVSQDFKKFNDLMIIQPTKLKFQTTMLNHIYYDLLRIYSNELEKENVTLFVMGFSFSDEHIRDITVRAANSNPTLLIYIFQYDDSDNIFKGMVEKAKNANIKIIKDKKYAFTTINDYFKKVIEEN